jgi:NADPH:quinone reductase-like Zn-dependent oxidoreductase
MGAEVTAVDSTAKLDILKSIGADHLVDYTKEDFRQNGVVYDVIFDVVGTLSLAASANSLTPDGTYLLANPLRGQIVSGPWHGWRSSHKVKMQTASGTVDDLVYLRDLIEQGKLQTVIDRSYPLEEIVEAHRYVETGAKIGNVVITVAHDGNGKEG